MHTKTENQMGLLYVLPVVVLVAFNAVIPLMAVVNYSTQETFGNNVFFFEGVKWFEQVLHSERFHASLLRQLTFTGIILAIEIPLGVAIALAMPRKGPSPTRSRRSCAARGPLLPPHTSRSSCAPLAPARAAG